MSQNKIQTTSYDQANWWCKIEPLASPLPARFQAQFQPSSNVLFDEMMLLCKGRSADRIKMPGKPIDKGYKIYALCNQGYKSLGARTPYKDLQGEVTLP